MKQIKLCVQLLVLILCLTQNITKAQPLRIDLTSGLSGGTNNLLSDTLLTGINRGAVYWSGGGYENFIDAKFSYLIKSLGVAPVFHAQYHSPIFNTNLNGALNLSLGGLMVNLGIEKSFRIGYSVLNASLGIGYDWETYKGEHPGKLPVSFTNNDIDYWSGLSLYLPFVKGLDAVLGYRFVFKKEQVITKRDSNIGYSLETRNINHLFMAGVSFSLMGKEKKKFRH